MLLATFFYSFLIPLIKKVGKDVPPFTIMTVSMFVLFLISLFASIFLEKSALPKLFTHKSPLALLVLFGIINAVAFWLIILASKVMPAWQVNMFGMLTPILSGIIAYFILGETLTINLFIGLAIAGAGLYIAVR